MNPEFRRVFQRNHECEHLWSTMRDQLDGNPCILHPSNRSCCMSELDLWVMGTPCPPFSDQNPNRSKVGAVEAHRLYPVTFKDAQDAIIQGHKAYLLEQVPGFDKPYHPGTEETPLDRSLGLPDLPLGEEELFNFFDFSETSD